jgi:hypothetical protein
MSSQSAFFFFLQIGPSDRGLPILILGHLSFSFWRGCTGELGCTTSFLYISADAGQQETGDEGQPNVVTQMLSVAWLPQVGPEGVNST